MEEEYQYNQFLDENSSNPFTTENLQENLDRMRRISDPIHKIIELPTQIWRIIDTPEFQRLRYIKQLGVTTFVFNGANHTRFEHCLGVAHLAWTYLDVIAKNHQYNYQEMNLKDQNHFYKIKLLVTIAGLCHDLGHGPFSHMFDNILLRRLNESTWTHEQGSCMMLKSLLLSKDRDFSTQLIKHQGATFDPNDELNIIFDMIQGLDEQQWEQNYKEKNYYPKWVFDIISNKTNSIDVDKFDYLLRDPSGLNVKHEYDCQRLFNETRIIDGHLCYNSKIHDQIYDIFNIRYKLFKNVYLHRVALGIELMLCDALEKADIKFEFKKIIQDPSKYVKLTDSIVEQIYNSEDEKLNESREILQRIYSRKIYKFVCEAVIPYEQKLQKQQVIDGISKHNKYQYENMEQKLSQEEMQNIEVIFPKINYCNGDKDPVDNVYFFKNSQPNEKKKLSSQSSSLLRPSKFGEKMIMVFVKIDDIHLINKVKNGFSNYTKEELQKEKSDYEKKELWLQKKDLSLFKQQPEKKIKLNPESEK